MPSLVLLRAAAWVRGVAAPPDPGWLRLRAALRTTLAGLLAWVAVLAAGTVTRVTTVMVLIAVAMGIYTAAFVREADRAGRAATILCATAAGGLGLIIGASVSPLPAAAALAMIGLVLVNVTLGSLGPRWPVLAQAALGAFTFALLDTPDRATLASWFVSLAAAGVASLAAHLVLLPDRPAGLYARLDRSVRQGVARALSRIDGALAQGSWAPVERRALLREVGDLGDVPALAETGGVPPDAVIRLFELVLMTERLARRALVQFPPPSELAPARRLVALLRAALPGGADIPSAADSSPLAVSLGNLAKVLAWPAPEMRRAAGPGKPSVTWVALRAGLRQAVPATIAAALAIGCGELISPRRWYWAAMTAYVLFLGTRSRTDSLAKGLQAVAGTLAGVVAGLLLASLLDGHETLAIASIFVAVFLAFQAANTYAVMTFWFTITLGLMYGVLGYVSRDLLALRLEETAVGAAFGVSTAWLFARSASRTTRAAARDSLEALAPVVRTAAAVLTEGDDGAGLPALVLTLQRRSQDLRAAARPKLHRFAGVADPALRRVVVVVGFCDDWARELAASALHPGPGLAGSPVATVCDAAARIAANAVELGVWLDPRPDDAAPSPQAAEAPHSVVIGLPGSGPDSPADRPLRLLLALDAALDHALRHRSA